MSVLLPLCRLESSPSKKDGIDAQTETLHRVFGCELIQEAGILLKLPQVVMVTGQNILHRFFYRKSLKRFDSFTVAMGSLLLASKVEEKPKLLREVMSLQKYESISLNALLILTLSLSHTYTHIHTFFSN